MATRRKYLLIAGTILALIGGLLLWANARQTRPQSAPVKKSFDGARALADVAHQLSLGPRIPGSRAHAQVRAWMRDELHAAGWQVETQETSRLGHPIFNIIAYRDNAPPQVILGVHYDSRLFADQDPNDYTQPVPAANDGASGVAVLLEIARALPAESVPVWLVFFDAEDNGNLPGWDWILGSRAFVDEYAPAPQAVVILDMIGDADLNIYRERNSDAAITDEIWAQAAALGYAENFIDEEKYSMLDDHTPFLEAGTPAVDIIDFDYPYWHTVADTVDKVSAESLKIVGDTMLAWLESRR